MQVIEKKNKKIKMERAKAKVKWKIMKEILKKWAFNFYENIDAKEVCLLDS